MSRVWNINKYKELESSRMILYLANTISRWEIVKKIEKENNIIIPNLLESFYYIKPKKQMNYIIKNVKNFMLDSGAFTFMNTKTNISKQDINKFTNKYIDFINEYDVDLFFEMDIDRLIGLNEVEKLRKLIEDRTNKKSIPVFHPERGKNYYLNMVKEYKYIALGGSASGGQKRYISFYPWFIKEAKKQNCKIHGLGFTALKKLQLPNWNFTSVDSSTWVQSIRFNRVFKFINNDLS